MEYDKTKELRDWRWGSKEIDLTDADTVDKLHRQSGMVLDEVERLERLVAAYRLVVSDLRK